MMFSDTLNSTDHEKNSENKFMSGSNPYGEENDNYFRSPIAMKGQMDQRACFTEAKVPFKNATNGTNLPQNHQFLYTADKKGQGNYQQALLQLSQNKLNFIGGLTPQCAKDQDENFGTAVAAMGAVKEEAMGVGSSSNTLSLSQINVMKNAESQSASQMLASTQRQALREYNPRENNGDRFIPCRQGSEKYEMQYQHEEHLLLNMKGSSNRTIFEADLTQHNTSTDSVGNISNQSGGSTSSGSGTQSMSPGDQNMQVYNNLLHSQCIYDAIYQDENSYQNLSYLDHGQFGVSNPHYPVGILSNISAATPVTGLSIGTSINQNINNAIKAKKSSIFKFQNNQKRKCGITENIDFSTNPFMSLDQCDYTSQNVKQVRKISKMPFKVLDAPSLQDDFYLNLVDWSASNVLAVGLGRAVYIWSACTSRVTKLCEVPVDDSITSVGWSQRGSHLAVGTNSGETQIWDTNHCKLVRTLQGHLSRVGTVAWNGSIVSTGSRDRNILQRDLRANNNFFQKLVGHKQEVCGLRWSFDETQLASGGNDNKLMVWSLQSGEQPLVKFSEHTAAVKAIGWSPHQNGLLASGGGTADRCIRFWNTHTLQPVSCIDTGSQVCNLMFSKNVNEIVSTHGYSLNQIIVWKYPTMQKVATLTGHTYRVLYLSMSPDGQSIVTGAGDETLRFWNVFPSVKGKSDSFPYSGSGNSSLFPSNMDIR